MWNFIFRNLLASLLVAVVAAPVLGQAGKTSAPDQAKLIAVLMSEASVKEKADACRQLATVGTRDAVPALAALLADERLAHMARYGLEPIPDPSVDEAFRAALGQLKGRPLVGVIGSIGVRRDAKAVKSLAQRLKDADPEVAQAAARSLGRIGTPEAVTALGRTLMGNAREGNQPALCEALFRCAEALASRGAREEARDIYDILRGSKQPPQVQAGALRGALLMRKKEDRLDLLRQQLRTADYPLFAAAVRAAQEVKEPEVAQVLVAEMKQLPVERQGMVIQAVACVAVRCLQGKDSAEVVGQLIAPLEQATKLASNAELRQQTKALLQEARKSATRVSSADGATPPFGSGLQKHFLEVGKTYSFTLAGKPNAFLGEVLMVRNDSWVKVDIKQRVGFVPPGPRWINLNQVVFVGDPPTAKTKEALRPEPE